MQPEAISDNKQDLHFSKSRLVFYIFTAIVFVFFIYYFSELKSDFKLFSKIQPIWLILALIAQVGTYLSASAIRRGLLKNFSSQDVSFKELVKLSIVILFINQAIPTVGLSGNTFFFGFLKKRNVPEGRALCLIFIELLTYYAAIITVIVFITICFLLNKTLTVQFIPILLIGLLVYLLLALLAGFLGRGKTAAFLVKHLSNIKFFKNKLKKYQAMPLTEIESPWHLIFNKKSIVAGVVILQTLEVLFDTVTIFALFWGLGLPVSFFLVLSGFILTRIVSLLPISPGSLILYEGSMTFFYVTFGAPLAVATVVTLLYRALSFWLPIPIGLYLYRKLQLSVEE